MRNASQTGNVGAPPRGAIVRALLLPMALLAFAVPLRAADPSPYQQLAAALAEQVAPAGPAPVNVGVGSFVYEDTTLLAPFSALLRDELELALPATGKFRVIARDRLADLQTEARLLQTAILEPGAAAPKVGVKEVAAIVRGRFYYKWPNVTVVAELARLDGGELRKARIELPAAGVAARLWPDPPRAAGAAQAKLASVLAPQNLAGSTQNVADVESRIRRVPHDFAVQLATADARRDYAAGERIAYRLRSETGCHMAVFCHQVDGATILLFPNSSSRDTWLPAGTTVEIPGAAKQGFEIVVGPPYGADVVQVVACTSRSALHAMVQEIAAKTGNSYGTLTRGMFVQGIDQSLAADPVASPSSPARWGEAHLVVCTYPKERP